MEIIVEIVKYVVKENLKKVALRVAQRKLGINKVMGLVRRFDKRHTFTQNFKKNPPKMIEKMFKQFIKRKILGSIPPVRYINNLAKYGIRECMKRFVFKNLDTEIKKPYYILKGYKSKIERYKIIMQGKDQFWIEINKLDKKSQAKVIDKVIKLTPDDPILKEYWSEVLDQWIHFTANSPMTENFSRLEIIYNITTQEMWLPIRGYAGTQVKTYKFPNIEWGLIKKAMEGADFGKDIYSKIRSARSRELGKFWANLDPYYIKR